MSIPYSSALISPFPVERKVGGWSSVQKTPVAAAKTFATCRSSFLSASSREHRGVLTWILEFRMDFSVPCTHVQDWVPSPGRRRREREEGGDGDHSVRHPRCCTTVVFRPPSHSRITRVALCTCLTTSRQIVIFWGLPCSASHSLLQEKSKIPSS